ncbi:MAG: N-ethylammeline chlorohydrolase [Candidatus Aenigmatarchaeota archaeon]|nr:MAG: N-ethylammeline chlorohydrolase [Candidatus Aenigmarchaeota archaeon]
MLLRNCRFIITQNQKREILENKDILIENGKVMEIGNVTEMGNNLSKKDEFIDCSDKIIIPGLINCHTHAAMNLLRGVSDDKNLQEWLNEDIWPRETKINGEFCYQGTLLAAGEMLLTGTTCFNDMYFHIGDVARAADKSGMRCFLGQVMFDFFDGEKTKKIIEDSESEIKKIIDLKNERINPTVTPHSVETCSDELLIQSRDLANKYNLLLHMHLSETEKEVTDCLKNRGKRPLILLDDLGLLKNKFIGAHGIHFNQEEINLLNQNKFFIIYNPCSNAKLASGICPAWELKSLCIGTDSVASNNNLNLFEEMKFGVLLQRVKYNDVSAMSTQRIFDSATIEGARALGIENDVGSIEIGKKADLGLIDKDNIFLNPNHNIISNLVYSFNGAVSDVIVEGEFAVRNKEIVNFDLEELIEKVEKFREIL